MSDDNKFIELGGVEILKKISKNFYDKVYKHPWISLYFKDIPQERIESQQVDFMTSSLGGGKVYSGRLPVPAHKHMYITEELFNLRQDLLKETFSELSISQDLQDRWLKIDEAFRPKLVKKSLSECEKRFVTDEILFHPNPIKKAA